MAAIILDGRELAKRLQTRLAGEVSELKAKGIVPRIASIQVTGDDASSFYTRNQAKLAEKLGIAYNLIELPNSITSDQLAQTITSLNNDRSVTGIMLQVPLPKHLDENRFQHQIAPQKDIEGVHPENIGAMAGGGDELVPCTARAAIELLLSSNIPIKGKHAVVLGRSRIVGKPAALMLLNRDATVTVCHSRTPDIGRHCREADILIAAVGGKPNLVTADMVKPGATVIDVATIAQPDGSITGDVDFKAVSEVAGAITPVPGGVGPVTVTILMRNAIIAGRENSSR
ncbi:MAG: bifunctional 5,10-methylenetetrahydrofolate dehydrogenase/5,10-methenyltetrahydrofolate cyclohydrolase [Planctomycetes bacterium]|nr:bifunctional 5,10-methylenetetrahydrofolate dehydrogenase/5,10-methenyltetrahydrofolate cyclohydrolase [Planctomycetota bacterium]NUQ34081.1 bifunctional 5,10-methylenetetrahydrofolate dehydrogenase/5,10-methenyltetrahydrofolate cyclohydrolase [Planctomycetaceae bacterium]